MSLDFIGEAFGSFIFIFFVIAVLFIHEMGHFSFMKLFKYTNVIMMFVPLMGAFVRGEKEKYEQKQSVLFTNNL